MFILTLFESIDEIYATLSKTQKRYIGDISFEEDNYIVHIVLRDKKVSVAAALGFKISDGIGIFVVVNKDYQHKGFGKKAIQMLIKRINKLYLKKELKTNELIYAVYKNNKNSLKLAKSCGFELDHSVDDICVLTRPINISTPRQINKLSQRRKIHARCTS